MSFLERLAELIGGGSVGPEANLYRFSVKCNRCGEVLAGRVNLSNDLSVDYREGDGPQTFVSRKVLIGTGRCFQSIEVSLRFDAGHRLTERQAAGGTFVD